MHAAEDARTTEGIEAVIAIAEQRQQALDSAEPAPARASGGAGQGGTRPLFGTLVITGRSILARLQGERAVTRSEAGRHRRKP
jgi:hypothetical protein